MADNATWVSAWLRDQPHVFEENPPDFAPESESHHLTRIVPEPTKRRVAESVFEELGPEDSVSCIGIRPQQQQQVVIAQPSIKQNVKQVAAVRRPLANKTNQHTRLTTRNHALFGGPVKASKPKPKPPVPTAVPSHQKTLKPPLVIKAPKKQEDPAIEIEEQDLIETPPKTRQPSPTVHKTPATRSLTDIYATKLASVDLNETRRRYHQQEYENDYGRYFDSVEYDDDVRSGPSPNDNHRFDDVLVDYYYDYDYDFETVPSPHGHRYSDTMNPYYAYNDYPTIMSEPYHAPPVRVHEYGLVDNVVEMNKNDLWRPRRLG